MLNPRLRNVGGRWHVDWTPDPTAEGYRITSPKGQTRTFDPARSTANLGAYPAAPAVTVEALDVVGRGPETAVDPTVPTPTVGAQIDVRWPWLRTYATLPATTTSLTPKSGTPGKPVVVDAAGQTPGKTILYDGDFTEFVVRDLANGDLAGDSFKVAGGVRRGLLQRHHAWNLSGTKPQGFNVQRGVGDFVVLGATWEIGQNQGDPKLAHGAYVDELIGDVLLAAVFAGGQGGRCVQAYNGPYNGHTLYVANATLTWSALKDLVVADGDVDVLVVNSILGPNTGGKPPYKETNGARIRFLRCCVAGGDQADPRYVECVFRDPRLDANGRPTDTALHDLADAEWMPPHDRTGKRYTTRMLGAVA